MPEPRAELAANRHVLEVRQIVGVGDEAFLDPNESRGRRLRCPSAGGTAVSRISAMPVDVAEDRVSPFLRTCGAGDLVEHRAGFIDRGGPQVGPAEVHSDGVFGHMHWHHRTGRAVSRFGAPRGAAEIGLDKMIFNLHWSVTCYKLKQKVAGNVYICSRGGV